MKAIGLINFSAILLVCSMNTVSANEEKSFCVNKIDIPTKLIGPNVPSEYKNLDFSEPQSIKTLAGKYPILSDNLSIKNKLKSDQVMSALWTVDSTKISGPYLVTEFIFYPLYTDPLGNMLFIDYTSQSNRGDKSDLMQFRAGSAPAPISPQIINNMLPPRFIMPSQLFSGAVIVAYEESSMYDSSIYVPIAENSSKVIDKSEATINLYKDGKIEKIVSAAPRVVRGQELIKNNLIVFMKEANTYFLDKSFNFSKGPFFWPNNSIGEFYEMNEAGWVYVHDGGDMYDYMLHLNQTETGITYDKIISIQIIDGEYPAPSLVTYSDGKLNDVEKEVSYAEGALKIGDHRQFSKALGHMITKKPIAEITSEGVVPIASINADELQMYVGDIDSRNLAVFIGGSGRMYAYDGKTIKPFLGEMIDLGTIINVPNSKRVFLQNTIGLYELLIDDNNEISPQKLQGADIYQNQSYIKTQNSYTPISIIQLNKTNDVLVLGYSGVFNEREGGLLKIWSPADGERLGNPVSVHHINDPEEIIFNTQSLTGNIEVKGFYRLHSCLKE